MNRKSVVAISAWLIAATMLLSCSGKSADNAVAAQPQAPTSGNVVKSTDKNAINLLCDLSFESIANDEIAVFTQLNPGATVSPSYLSENECIKLLLDDPDFGVAIVSRELTETEVRTLKNSGRPPRSSRIAVDAIAIIVNPQNEINSLPLDDVREILAGNILDWGKVELGNKSGKIEIVVDNAQSSTANFISNSLLDGEPLGAKGNLHSAGNNRDLFNYVAQNRGAIGIIGTAWLSGNFTPRQFTRQQAEAFVNSSNDNLQIREVEMSDRIKVVAISNPTDENYCDVTPYLPYQQYIYGNDETGLHEYPLVRSIYAITTATPNSPGSTSPAKSSGSKTSGSRSSGSSKINALSFYNFLTEAPGQKVIISASYLPGQIHL